MEISVDQEITITIGEYRHKITIEECRHLRDRLNEIMGNQPKTISSRSPLDQVSLRKAYEDAMAESRTIITEPMAVPAETGKGWQSKEYVPIPENRWTPPEFAKPEDIF